MRARAGQVLVAACLMALLVSAMPTVHAFDGSIDTNTAQSSTLNPQQLQSVLTELNQESNNSQLSSNPQFEQLLSQFNSSLTSGNSNLTASNLAQLQNFMRSQNSSGLLSNLIKSLQTTGNGVTVNPSELSSLLNLSGGLPNGVGRGNALQEMNGLSSIANLVKDINPQLAAQLLNAVENLSLKFGIPIPSSLNFGSLGFLKGLQSPKVAAPKLGSSSSPKIQLELLLVPIIIVAACLTLFIFRGRLADLLRGQKTPGVVEEELQPLEYDPSDPKKRILYYFAKSVQFMKGRGISKSSFETGREFTKKCQDVSGSEHVDSISKLYEKAQFSGRPVTNDDANLAEKELSSLESPLEVKPN